MPFSFGATFFWKKVLLDQHIYLNERFDVIAMTALIAFFGLIYCLMATVIITIVWNEFKAIRMAVKEYDIETFMNLKDEEMTPLVHTVMFVIGSFVLAGFMLLKYPDLSSGLICIGSVSYLLSLIFFVAEEIDDPCRGIWTISIPEEWLKINAKKYREKRNKEKHAELLKKIGDWPKEMFG